MDTELQTAVKVAGRAVSPGRKVRPYGWASPAGVFILPTYVPDRIAPEFDALLVRVAEDGSTRADTFLGFMDEIGSSARVGDWPEQ